MATYLTITDSETDPDAPLTSELAKKWRDNPVAIAEGSVGAPYVEAQWYPYDSLAVGDGGTGEIWSLAADGVVNTITTPDFVDGYDYALLLVDVTRGGGTGGGIRVEVYGETSGTYSGQIEIPLDTSATYASALCELLLLRNATARRKPVICNIDGTPRFVDAASSQKVLRIRLTGRDGGALANINTGSIHLYRRRSYL